MGFGDTRLVQLATQTVAPVLLKNKQSHFGVQVKCFVCRPRRQTECWKYTKKSRFHKESYLLIHQGDY